MPGKEESSGARGHQGAGKGGRSWGHQRAWGRREVPEGLREEC